MCTIPRGKARGNVTANSDVHGRRGAVGKFIRGTPGDDACHGGMSIRGRNGTLDS